VPIHGELRHLHAQARLARELGMPRENVLVVENGYVLEFTPQRATIGERVPGGYVFVDGTGVGDVGPTLLREREQLANDGFVVVTVALDRQGRPAAPPRIVTRGFVFQPESGELIAGISARVTRLLDELAHSPHTDLETALRQDLEEYLYRETRRKPIVIPLLTLCNFS
jgi:ribonuclease J